MVLEVVGQDRADRSLDHPLGEDLAEFLREKVGGDDFSRLGIDVHRLKLRVNPPGEVAPNDGVFALKVLEGEIAGLSQPSARVLAEVEAPQLLGTRRTVEEKPGLASFAGDPQARARGGLVENVLLRLEGSEGGNPGFR